MSAPDPALSQSGPSWPPFPGSTGITGLRVYPWEARDGDHGGSPHVHLICTECYVVVGGRGRLQTLTMAGADEYPLAPGDVVWFTPGTIHRAVNDGDLEVMVVMQNDGLPEAGDAVMTLPSQYLSDSQTYQQAVNLTTEPGALPSPGRARKRRDLAVTGFTDLRERCQQGDFTGLAEFYRAARHLVADRLNNWRHRVEAGALAAAQRSQDQIAALQQDDLAYLSEARTVRLPAPSRRGLGMCGYLSTYRPDQRD